MNTLFIVINTWQKSLTSISFTLQIRFDEYIDKTKINEILNIQVLYATNTNVFSKV